jgi:hypothetical protein
MKRTKLGLLIHRAIWDCMKMWHSADIRRKVAMPST